MVTLTKPAAGDTDWATEVNDNWTTIQDELNLLTTKGDLLVRGESSNLRLGVGADGLVLVADSSQTCGVKWGTGDHGALTGLLDDDHTQYPLLAGRGGAPAVTNAEFGYLAGVTSSIQTQLGARPTGTGTINRLAYWTGADTIDDLAAIAANRILVSDANGLPVANATLTATRIPYADANGLLTDSANLLYAGGVLHVGISGDTDVRFYAPADANFFCADAGLATVGIGSSAVANYKVCVISTIAAAGGNSMAVYARQQPNGATNRAYGGFFAAIANDTWFPTGGNYGVGLAGVAESQTTGANSCAYMYGLLFSVRQAGSGNIADARGIDLSIQPNWNGTGIGTITNVKGINCYAQTSGSTINSFQAYLTWNTSGSINHCYIYDAILDNRLTVNNTFCGLRVDATGVLGNPSWIGLYFAGQNFAHTLRGYLRLGTTTDAATEGDLSTGLTGAARLFYDQSAATLYLYGASGAIANQISSVAGTETVFNAPGNDQDFRVEGDTLPYMLWVDASTDRLLVGESVVAPYGNQPRMHVGSVTYGAGEDHYAFEARSYPTGGVTRRTGGGAFYAEASDTSIPTTELLGLVGVAFSKLTSGNSLPTAYGLRFAVYQNGTGTITDGYGVYAGCYNYATAGVFTSAKGGYFYVNADAGQVVAAYGLFVQLAGGSGTGITGNNYGLYIAAPTGNVGGNQWGIYQDGTEARNDFLGRMRIGSTTRGTTQGDWATGLTNPGAELFFDESETDLYLYNADVIQLAWYGDEAEMYFADAAAAASAAGRLRRNGTFLSWHNGTSGQSILTQHLATAKGDLLVATAANALAALAVGATDGRPLIVKAAAGAGVAWCGVGELARDAYPDFVASGASHAKGAVPDPGATSGTTKFLREDATWAVPSGADTWVRKTADETVTSSVTLQDDDHLYFAIGASEEWCAKFELDVTCNDLLNVGMRLAITVPSGYSALNICVEAARDTGTFDFYQHGTVSGTTIQISFTGGTNAKVRVTVWVLNGVTAGNVQLRWAQKSSSATSLTLRQGSFLEAHKVA